MNRAITVLLVAFGLSVALTLVSERLARRFGLVARPVADRWHRQTIPMLGGIAIVVGTLVPAVVVARTSANFVALAIVATAMALVGLVDDVRRLSPQAKLLAQLLLGSVLLFLGFSLRLTGFPLADVLLTLFWVVGITNAFNLLDNMDGLSSTIAIVTAAFRLLFFVWEGDLAGALVTVAFIGAVGGFLTRNFPPAKIFMGDTGSLFLGFFLAGLSLVADQSPYSRGVAAVLIIPVLLLSIPIFDTAFVTVTRIMTGRRVGVGGRDHTSHRLVAIGLSERQTVLFLALLAASAGGVAVLSYRAGLGYAVVLLALLVIGLVLLGIHLGRVRVVQALERPDSGSVVRVLADFQYKRQVFTLLLDACLIPLAYYSAYVIRFEDALPLYLGDFYRSLPAVLTVQLIVFAGFGLYRGIWQFTSVPDMVRIGKAAALGTMASVVLLVYAQRFVGFSRTVFLLDALLLVVLWESALVPLPGRGAPRPAGRLREGPDLRGGGWRRAHRARATEQSRPRAGARRIRGRRPAQARHSHPRVAGVRRVRAARDAGPRARDRRGHRVVGEDPWQRPGRGHRGLRPAGRAAPARRLSSGVTRKSGRHS